MKTLMPCRHISISVKSSASDVYQFVANPENLPKWASGLSNGQLTRQGEEWIAESPMGEIKIKFAAKNEFGVLDHYVTIGADSEGAGNEMSKTFYNPMRVFKNGDGCEVIFTLFRQPEMTDEKFEEDSNWIMKDLKQLKNLIEE